MRKKSTLFAKKFWVFSIFAEKEPAKAGSLRDYTVWFEIQLVRREQFELDSVPHSLLGKAVACSMEMSVIAITNLIFFQKV